MGLVVKPVASGAMASEWQGPGCRRLGRATCNAPECPPFGGPRFGVSEGCGYSMVVSGMDGSDDELACVEGPSAGAWTPCKWRRVLLAALGLVSQSGWEDRREEAFLEAPMELE